MQSELVGERDVPPSQYDLDTYWGRVRHMSEILDPRTLWVSNQGIQEAEKTISAYKRGELTEASRELWAAKKVLDSALHPDTGEPVFRPFRMSCYVLSGLPATALMLSPGIGPLGAIIGQVLNQSLNVAVNYSNANESSRLSPIRLAQSYLLAVGVSCSVAVGMAAGVSRMSFLRPRTKLLLSRLSPFAAVASAGVLNVFLVRGEELRVGIDVYPSVSKSSESTEKIGEIPSLGKSKKAALIAVSETAFSRVLNCAPVMVIPPLLLIGLQNTRWLKNNPRLLLPVNLGLITATSFVALPFALAAFPQTRTVWRSQLEPEVHYPGKNGGKVFFNRGI